MSVYVHTYCTRCVDTGPVLDYGKQQSSGESGQAEAQRQWLRKHAECLHMKKIIVLPDTQL